MSKKPGPPGGQTGPVRLRQIALVARDLKKMEELLVRRTDTLLEVGLEMIANLMITVLCPRHRGHVQRRGSWTVGTREYLAYVDTYEWSTNEMID